jgi:hypothetical protein
MAAQEKAEAVRALTDMVTAARRLSNAWEKLDDTTFLDAAYPKGMPSFDEFVEQLSAWRDFAKSATRR